MMMSMQFFASSMSLDKKQLLQTILLNLDEKAFITFQHFPFYADIGTFTEHKVVVQ